MADSDDNRAEAGRWTKGRSGNPGGRPKLPEEVKAQIRGLAPLAIAALAKALESEDERVVVAAATQILDRGYGKPAQTVNAKIEGVDIAEAHLQALQDFTQSGNTEDQAAKLLTVAAGSTTTEH
jgi:hypothetical protein